MKGKESRKKPVMGNGVNNSKIEILSRLIARTRNIMKQESRKNMWKTWRRKEGSRIKEDDSSEEFMKCFEELMKRTKKEKEVEREREGEGERRKTFQFNILCWLDLCRLLAKAFE